MPVLFEMAALVINAAVPMQPEGFKASQDRIDSFRAVTWRIEVVNSQQPLSVMGVGVEITGKGGKERTEM